VFYGFPSGGYINLDRFSKYMVRHNREEWKTYKNVFDKFTEGVLVKLQGQGHFDELVQPITLGKEANVFIATKREEFVIVKIYRTMNANFNKMHDYLVHDARYHDIKANKRKVIFAWVQREFANLLLAREHVRVPTPYSITSNVLVMELIGTGSTPAPMLKDAPPKNPQAFYEEIRAMMKTLRERGLVHGDLSAFNILNHDEHPVFIDFSQGTTSSSPGADELYHRDIKNVNAYFTKLRVPVRD
jgi:RIO kinase 1